VVFGNLQATVQYMRTTLHAYYCEGRL